MSQPQWDPESRRWYFPEGQGPPPPPQAPQGGRAEPPGYRQGFSAAQSPPPPARRAARHGGGDSSMESPTVAVRPRLAQPSAEAIRSTPSGGAAVAQAPAPAVAPTPAARKRRKWPWVLGGIVLLIVIIAAASSGGGAAPTPSQAAGTAPTPAAPAAPVPESGGNTGGGDQAPAASGVVYEVTGSGKAMNITYGSDGGISQENGERLPWTKTAPAADGFGIYSLSAQNSGSGEITCRITVDGEKVAEQTSSGQYAVVSCTGNGSPFG